MSTPIYVSNLPANATDADLRGLFRHYGRVTSVSIKPAHAAFTEGTVEMFSDRDAAGAVLALRSSHIDSRAMSFSLQQRRADEVSWDGRSGGISSQVHWQR